MNKMNFIFSPELSIDQNKRSNIKIQKFTNKTSQIKKNIG